MLWGKSQSHRKDLNHMRNRPHGNVVVVANCGRHGLLQSEWFSGKWRHGQTLANLCLWLHKASEILKRRTAHLCKTLCSLETNHQNVLTKCGHAVSELGNVKWITDVKPLNYIITLVVIQNDVYQKLIATATCPSISLEPNASNATFWLHKSSSKVIDEQPNLMQLDCTAQRPMLWMLQVQNLATKMVKPGDKLLQITVSKWQHPNFCQAKGCWLSSAPPFHHICHWKLPLLTTKCFCENGFPGHEQCESFNSEVWRPCYTESSRKSSCNMVSIRTFCSKQSHAYWKATCWMRS